MTVLYSSDSPYASTGRSNDRLDLLNPRKFPFEKDDLIYAIDPVYNNRPDLLAHDLYGKTGLWWVFAVRNPDVLIDPIFDFITGMQIYLPQQATLENALEI
tara:strand:+ start:1723 stop:2025 length:303 start_codon:yes stop_codon:yes gene_type:complete